MKNKNLTKLGSNNTVYNDKYDSSLLETIERETRRKEYNIPMIGTDIWTCFEVSFLNKKGLPQFMVIRISNPADSKYIFESKSLKLYLNSFNNTSFEDKKRVLDIIESDLNNLTESEVEVVEINSFPSEADFYNNVVCLEDMIENKNMKIENYIYSKDLLKTMSNFISLSSTIKLHLSEINLYSDLLRSNCEITNQPDWGRVFISFIPDEKLVDYPSLLKYIISFRNHQEFHEPTCERIYNDLFKLLSPKSLTVICQYTRRGGIDINPIRVSDSKLTVKYSQTLPKLIQQ